MNLSDAISIKMGETDATSVRVGADLTWPLYPAEVLADNPLVYMRFQETVPDNGAYDFSGNGLNADYVGSIVLGEDGPITSDPNSKAVRTSSPDGSFPRVRWTDAQLWMPDGPYTFEHWIYKEDSRAQASFSFGASNNYLEFITYTNTGVFHGAVTNLSHPGIGNTWVHHVITNDAESGGTGTLRLYIDGVLTNSGGKNTITIPETSSYLVLGQEQDGNDSLYDVNQAFWGMIAEPAVYDYALSASRIADHYAAAIA